MQRMKVGEQFGLLTVLELQPRNTTDRPRPRALCLCKCGVKKSIERTSLRAGIIRSCGCMTKQWIAKARTTHGATGTSEFYIWRGMRKRCHLESDPHYKDYGGRGIVVCDRWRNSFENFLADMGRKPSRKHSLDRINNNGNYEPSNCRWATLSEQNSNKRTNVKIPFQGQIYNRSQLARKLGVDVHKLSAAMLHDDLGSIVARIREGRIIPKREFIAAHRGDRI